MRGSKDLSIDKLQSYLDTENRMVDCLKFPLHCAPFIDFISDMKASQAAGDNRRLFLSARKTCSSLSPGASAISASSEACAPVAWTSEL